MVGVLGGSSTPTIGTLEASQRMTMSCSSAWMLAVSDWRRMAPLVLMATYVRVTTGGVV